MKLYAIKQCDTVKKAMKWLEENGIEYAFHDYKKLGADEAVLAYCCQAFGWEQVVNRKGMTWRKLDEAQKENVTDDASAIALMKEKTSVIKRPILEYKGGFLLGFNADEWQKALR